MRKLFRALQSRFQGTPTAGDEPAGRAMSHEKLVRLARERDEVLARVSFGAG